jgi:hypothetical protein
MPGKPSPDSSYVADGLHQNPQPRAAFPFITEPVSYRLRFLVACSFMITKKQARSDKKKTKRTLNSLPIHPNRCTDCGHGNQPSSRFRVSPQRATASESKASRRTTARTVLYRLADRTTTTNGGSLLAIFPRSSKNEWSRWRRHPQPIRKSKCETSSGAKGYSFLRGLTSEGNVLETQGVSGGLRWRSRRRDHRSSVDFMS